VTSSAIKENAYVTQVELKRMQLQHLVSLEEMKLTSLQAELRAAIRRKPNNIAVTVEMVDLLLQDNDSLLHIRDLKQEIAHLDPDWEESLDVFKQDVKLIDQAIAHLTPYSAAIDVGIRLVQLRSEQRKAVAALNHLEATLLKRDLDSLKYPPFSELTLDQMGELLDKIPGDLTRLNAGEMTPAKQKLISDLTETQRKIKAYYPRKKLESLIGPVPSLDYQKPYPERPEDLQPMMDQIRADLEKVNSLPRGPIRSQFNQELSSRLTELTERAFKNIPGVKKKKRKLHGFIIVILAIVGLGCLLAAIIFATAVYRSIKEDGTASGLVSQFPDFMDDNAGDSSGEGGYVSGKFEPYQQKYVEVTASTTFLRETPDTNAGGSVKVVRGEILVDLEESGLSSSWYKVRTMDGTETGYLARDWVNPILVEAVPGDTLFLNKGERVYTEDFVTSEKAWEPETFDDEYATGSTVYLSEEFVVEMITNQPYVYRYATLIIDNLPEEYYYLLSATSEGNPDTVYYGIQTNVTSTGNFDAMLLSSDGAVKVLLVRNNEFSLIYDSEDPENTMAIYNASGANLLSMHRYVDADTGAVVNEYALNDAILARITFGDPSDLTNEMGWMIFVDEQDVESIIRFDDFIIEQ